MYTNKGFLNRDFGAIKHKAEDRLPALKTSRNALLESPKVRSPYQGSFRSPPSQILRPSLRQPLITPSSNIDVMQSLEGARSMRGDMSVTKLNPVNSRLALSSSMPSLLLHDSPGYDHNEQRMAPGVSIGNILSSIFEIYGVGYAYSTAKGYGNPLGIGFLISEHLAMTANSVIPTEEIASRCFCRFADNIYETHNFDPQEFFYTNRSMNFTVVGFKINSESRKPRHPIEIREEFTLQDGHQIAFLNAGMVPKMVTGVDAEVFMYTAGQYISPGMPIFTRDWRLQGIHHTCTSSYRFNQGTRIDAIVMGMMRVKNLVAHPELDLLLSNTGNITSLQKTKGLKLGETRYLYWVEWFQCNIYQYDSALTRWHKVRVGNLEDFMMKEHSDWTFNWNSRIVYLPDTSILIIGGVGNELSATKADVYQFYPDAGVIGRKNFMLEQREGPAVCIRQNFVYVMGGKYSYNTSERYDLKEESWSMFAPMVHGRYNASACILQNDQYMYVVGGEPAELVGLLVERYAFTFDRWEALGVKLPVPMVNAGLFPVSQKKMAILGGRMSRAVMIFEVDDGGLEANKPNKVIDEVYRLYEVEGFDVPLETVYPVTYSSERNTCYIIKGKPGSEAPKVVTYFYRNFLKPPENAPMEYRRTVQLPNLKMSTKHLLPPEYFDTYF